MTTPCKTEANTEKTSKISVNLMISLHISG